MWHIGQEVIYIGNDPNYPKGVRTIQGLIKTACCGKLLIDTGLSLPSYYANTVCVSCNKVVSGSAYWKRESDFRPVDFAEEVLSAIKEQVKEETILN